MAVYYKWIKGCASGANLSDGAWSLISWGSTVGESTSSLPKLEISTGRDGTKTNLGYVLTNNVKDVVVNHAWKFASGLSVDAISAYTENSNLTISPAVSITKNGTSFIVNNAAHLLSSMGISTAILDMTKNKNSYYIYTKNEEHLRNIAYESIKKLTIGITNGIEVDKNLIVGIDYSKEIK